MKLIQMTVELGKCHLDIFVQDGPERTVKLKLWRGSGLILERELETGPSREFGPLAQHICNISGVVPESKMGSLAALLKGINDDNL
jgi:hypothetical protein